MDEATDVALQEDGKVVAVSGAGGLFGVARYTPDGTLDPTFSGNGKVRTSFGPNLESAKDVAIQDDGRIVAAGVADDTDVAGVDPTFALARYLVA